MQVADTGQNVANKDFVIRVADLLTITTTGLTAGKVGVPYSFSLIANGGITPYTWSINFGTLPPGLSLNPLTGVISGVPTTAGATSAQYRVTDSANPPTSPVTLSLIPLTINP